MASQVHQAYCLFQRLMRLTRIDRKRGCYVWMGPKTSYKRTAYGKLTVRVPVYAGGTGEPTGQSTHKLAYETFVKRVPEKAPAGKRWEVGHKCHNSLCWNPAHLRAILNTTNIRERDERRVSRLSREA